MAKNEELKKENIQAVRTYFYQGGTWTKNTLSEKTGLSLAGTTNVLQELQEADEIIYIGDAASTGGRKSKEYRLNVDFCHLATVYCCRKAEQYYFQLQIFNLHQEELQKVTVFSDEGSLDDFQKTLAIVKKDPKVKFLAVSIPGVCRHGKVDACDFPLLVQVDLGKIIRRKCGIPYVIENDVNTACVSYASHDRTLKNIALIYQPACEYIGCGILIDGRLYNGTHHEAGEMKQLGERKMPPQEDLKRSIRAVHAVMDPQKIIWCSEIVKELDDPFPDLIHINEIDSEIQNGLYQIGMHQLLKLRKEEE